MENPKVNDSTKPGKQTEIDFEAADKLEGEKKEFIKKYRIITENESKLHIANGKWYYEGMPIDKYFESIENLYKEKEKGFNGLD